MTKRPARKTICGKFVFPARGKLWAFSVFLSHSRVSSFLLISPNPVVPFICCDLISFPIAILKWCHPRCSDLLFVKVKGFSQIPMLLGLTHAVGHSLLLPPGSHVSLDLVLWPFCRISASFWCSSECSPGPVFYSSTTLPFFLGSDHLLGFLYYLQNGNSSASNSHVSSQISTSNYMSQAIDALLPTCISLP